MDKEIYVLYYDLPKILNEKGIPSFIDNVIKPIMDKFDDAGKCAILLPKDLVTYKLMTKEEALKKIEEVKEYVETWPE